MTATCLKCAELIGEGTRQRKPEKGKIPEAKPTVHTYLSHFCDTPIRVEKLREMGRRHGYRTLWKPGWVENCEMVVQISLSISLGLKL